MVDIPFRLGLYEAKTIVPIQIFDPGTHQVIIGMPAGNSLLSTVFVQYLDPATTVKINYYDFGPGDGTLAGERVDLEGHTLISTAPISNRRIISRLVNKPRLEIIVTGGQAVLGVHVGVVSDFPQEPELLDGQDVDFTADKGSPIMVLGSDDKWYAWRGDNGVGKVEIVGSVQTNLSPLSSVSTHKQTYSTADFEYSYTFPAGTKNFYLKTPTPNARLLISWAISQTSTLGQTVYPGSEYARINLDPSITWSIFWQSNKPNTIIEIESWG